jgi:hypothetical protein
VLEDLPPVAGPELILSLLGSLSMLRFCDARIRQSAVEAAAAPASLSRSTAGMVSAAISILDEIVTFNQRSIVAQLFEAEIMNAPRR